MRQQCICCERNLILKKSFSRNKDMANGYQSVCKQCRTRQHKQRQASKNELSGFLQRWGVANRGDEA